MGPVTERQPCCTDPCSPLGRMWGGTTALLLLLARTITSKMVMDESSCLEVEEEECGLCHTVYMEECAMKEVPEMRPAMVQVCTNTTKEVEECKMVDEIVEQEEMRQFVV